MASNDLRLQVVLQALDNATAPLRRINKASGDTAQALKAARDKLKVLNEQQKAVGAFREVRNGLQGTSTALASAQARVQQLARQIGATGAPTKAMAAEFKAARQHAAALGATFQQQQQKAQRLRDELAAVGISTSALGGHEKRLRADIQSTTQAIADQTARLKAQAITQKRIADLKARHGKTMMHAAMVGGGGAAAIGAGRAIARPMGSVVGAFADREEAQSQLASSMMRADGSAPEELQKLTELATRLGDKLPGTTADFQNMMTMLVRQGMSAKTILGGLGESAAFLGVQLKMSATEAAEFAAKMQDSTRTAERDMMGLMDVIQRTFYLGVDPKNMLQGFTKLSPLLTVLRKDGLGAAQDLAPLLVMMDQTGMAGESAGNAIRKVFQAGVDAKKIGKANAALKDMKAGFELDFTDGQGEFGSIDQMFAQIDKLKALDSVERTSVVKTLFGDDAETLQVLNTLMAKGKAGYDEIIAKMQAQADLRKRVEAELGTLKNVAEAAEGSFTNALSDIGATAAPQLKELLTWLGELATKVGDFARENPRLTSTLVIAAGALAVFATAGGALALGLAGILGPMLAFRFGLQMLGLKGGVVANSIKLVGNAFKFLGKAMLANPLFLAIGLLALAAILIYSNWEGIKGGLLAIWDELGGSFTAVLGNILKAILDWSPLGMFYRALAPVLNWFGLELPATFTGLGAQLIKGLINGIDGMFPGFKSTVMGFADGAITWFKEALGIKSPSRVFMLAGEEISNGAAIGIAGQQDRVRKAALGLAGAAAAALPMVAGAGTGGMLFDSRPPIGAAAAAPRSAAAAAGDTITFNIHAAPGADAQAIARAVRAEMDRRDREKRARMSSSLADID